MGPAIMHGRRRPAGRDEFAPGAGGVRGKARLYSAVTAV